MSTTAPTRPTLLSIEQGDTTLRFTERGTAHGGIVMTIRPGDADALQRAIDAVNGYGGPNAWKVEAVTRCEHRGYDDTPCGDPVVDYLDYTAVCEKHAALHARTEANA